MDVPTSVFNYCPHCGSVRKNFNNVFKDAPLDNGDRVRVVFSCLSCNQPYICDFIFDSFYNIPRFSTLFNIYIHGLHDGSWAFYITCDVPGKGAMVHKGSDKEEEYGRSPFRAALTAIYSAIAMIHTLEGADRDNYGMVIFTAYDYIANAYNLGWIDSWRTNGFISQDKKKVSNYDLWEKIDKEIVLLKDRFIRTFKFPDDVDLYFKDTLGISSYE